MQKNRKPNSRREVPPAAEPTVFSGTEALSTDSHRKSEGRKEFPKGKAESADNSFRSQTQKATSSWKARGCRNRQPRKRRNSQTVRLWAAAGRFRENIKAAAPCQSADSKLPPPFFAPAGTTFSDNLYIYRAALAER